MGHFPQIVAPQPSERLITEDKAPGYFTQPSAGEPPPPPGARFFFNDRAQQSKTTRHVVCTDLFSPPGPGGTACKRLPSSSLPSLPSRVGERKRERERKRKRVEDEDEESQRGSSRDQRVGENGEGNEMREVSGHR